MTDLAITKKKDLAKLLYTKENLTQAEIAERVGVTRVTINKWINSESWEMLKVSITITKEEQLKNMYRQIAEINEVIIGREKGQRFATSAEADMLCKITKAIKQMETEIGISEIISAFDGLMQFLRMYDSKLIDVFKPVLNAYVHSKSNF
jgi:transcriptional regulator with XRE-family HTH domain